MQVCERGPQQGQHATLARHAELLLVGRALKRDFERNGVHLDHGSQQQLAALAQDAHETGVQFGGPLFALLTTGLSEIFMHEGMRPTP